MSPNFAVCLSETRRRLRFSQPTPFMLILRKLYFVALVLFTGSLSAQYTGVINSNRPGFSESPYSVGSGIYQLEMSIFNRKTDYFPTFSRPQSTGIEFLFRTSFFDEKLELNLNFAYQRSEIGFQNIFYSSYFASGIRNLRIGGKYLLYEQDFDDKSAEIRSWKKRFSFDWKRMIPSVAVYGGINTGLGNKLFDLYGQTGFSPVAGVLLQNDLSSELNVVTNVFYDKIGTEAPEFVYIVTATYSYNQKWSTFFETQVISNKFQVETNLGTGLAYLWNKDLQINGSLRFITDGPVTGAYTSIGASYRLDKHTDDFIEVDAFGNPIEEIELNEGKGFFGKIWSNITGLFGKKKKKKAKAIVLKDKTLESIKKNTYTQESTIKNDTINKAEPKPIRTRPKRVRVKPGKYKSVKSKKKSGGFLGIFGKSKKDDEEDKDKDKESKKKEKEEIDKMSEKEINRELRKLEKEQKKLEKQQKKEEARKKKEEAKKKKKQKKEKKNEEGNEGEDS